MANERHAGPSLRLGGTQRAESLSSQAQSSSRSQAYSSLTPKQVGGRRPASRPISIRRSTSTPGRMDDLDGEGRRGSSLEWGVGYGRRQQCVRPAPGAPLMAGSLPPSNFLEELPPLSLGPGSFPGEEAETHVCGSLGGYALSCPSALWGGPGSLAAMMEARRPSALGVVSEEDCSRPEAAEQLEEEGAQRVGASAQSQVCGTPQSMTAFYLLEELSKQAGKAMPEEGEITAEEEEEEVDDDGLAVSDEALAKALKEQASIEDALHGDVFEWE
ncbi:unnamed protein product [Chrysoparadoxa australica]